MDYLDIKDPLNAPAILAAVINGQYGTVRAMLDSGLSPDTTDNNGWSLLQAACRRRRWDIARLLLDHGAVPTANKGSGASPVESAASAGDLWTVLRLHEAGASLEGALGAAAAAGHLHLVRYLLDRGCPVDERDQWDDTPLMSAASEGHAEVVALLLEHGADSSATSDGETAQDQATLHRHANVVDVLDGAGPPNRRWMRWFTPELPKAEIERGGAVERMYRSHIASLWPRIPEPYRVLAECGGKLSLHDARFVSFEDSADGALQLDIEAWDQLDLWRGAKTASGAKLRLRINYTGAEIVTPRRELQQLCFVQPVDIISGELDLASDDRLEHRFEMAWWTPTVAIRFKDVDLPEFG
jgi:hypothetical protein